MQTEKQQEQGVKLRRRSQSHTLLVRVEDAHSDTRRRETDLGTELGQESDQQPETRLILPDCG